jgi:hypothetical protein
MRPQLDPVSVADFFALWVREGPPFRLDARAAVVVAAFLVLGYPAYLLLRAVLAEPWLIALWMAVYAIDVLAVTYALQNPPSAARFWRPALVAATIAAAIGILIAAISILPNVHQLLRPADMLVTGLKSGARPPTARTRIMPTAIAGGSPGRWIWASTKPRNDTSSTTKAAGK